MINEFTMTGNRAHFEGFSCYFCRFLYSENHFWYVLDFIKSFLCHVTIGLRCDRLSNFRWALINNYKKQLQAKTAYNSYNTL